MLELRPIGGFIFGLNLCLLIWRISVQEPAMLEAESNSLGHSNGAVIHYDGISNNEAFREKHQPHQMSYSSKHLLSENGNSLNSSFIFKKLEDNESFTTTQNDANGKYSHQITSSQYKNKRKSLRNFTNLNSKANKALTKSSFQTKDSNFIIYNKTLALSLYNLSRNVYTKKSTTFEKPPSPSVQPKPPPPPLPPAALPSSSFKTSSDERSSSSSSFSSFLADKTFVPSYQKQTTNSFIPVLTPKPHPFNLITKASTEASSFFPQAEDYFRLIDLNGFSFLLEQPSCAPEIKALILVHSAPLNFEKRQLIRETWASKSFLQNKPFQIIFLLGSVDNSTLQNILFEEYKKYNDIVQGNFNDDYYNMTYKHVMAFKWFLYKCPRADLLIKVDDDVYVNTPQLYDYYKKQKEDNQLSGTTPWPLPLPSLDLRNFSSLAFKPSETLFTKPVNLLFCEQCIGSRVKRTYRSKWRVSFKEYNKRFYPPYCPGYAIIYSTDVVKKLYAAAQKHSYFWIDDVHITGILAQQNNISISNSKEYVLFEKQCDGLLSGKTDYNSVEFIFAWHRTTPKQIRQLWNLYLQQKSSLKNLSLKSPSFETFPLNTNALR